MSGSFSSPSRKDRPSSAQANNLEQFQNFVIEDEIEEVLVKPAMINDEEVGVVHNYQFKS